LLFLKQLREMPLDELIDLEIFEFNYRKKIKAQTSNKGDTV
jgi:hypothetical protein